jgi:hypothetical protein
VRLQSILLTVVHEAVDGGHVLSVDEDGRGVLGFHLRVDRYLQGVLVRDTVAIEEAGDAQFETIPDEGVQLRVACGDEPAGSDLCWDEGVRHVCSDLVCLWMAHRP